MKRGIILNWDTRIKKLLSFKSVVIGSALLIGSLFPVNSLQAQLNTGLKSPGTSFNTSGTVPTFANALASDNVYTSFTTNGDATAYGGFSLTTIDAGGVIPTGAAILGIEVQLEGNRVTSGGQFTRDLNISLSWNNGTSYTTAITMTRYSSGTDATVSVGGSSNTWGRTWAVSDLTNPNFRIRCLVPAAALGSINLDAIQVRVYYCIPPAAPVVTSPIKYCINAAAAPLTASGAGLLWYNTPAGTGSSVAPTPVTTAAGTTSYYVSQTIGCEGPQAQIDVIVNPLPVTSATSTNITCFGAGDGTIAVTASGGTGPYTFSVDGTNFSSETSPGTRLFTGLLPNTPYTIKVKDSNGCVSK